MTASAQEILPDSSFDWMFWPVARLDPLSAWSGHVPFAHWLVAKARPLLIVELGTHTGVSYAAFCQAVRQASPFSRCFAVDTWQGDPQAGKYGEDVYESLKAFHDARFRGFSKLLRKTFDEAVEEFEDGTIDLLHIDGLHSYEAVRHDFETWLPKLSRKAVVLFHDTHEQKEGFGVWQLWDELKKRYPSFEFSHCHGLGVLKVGPDAPSAVSNLCATWEPAAIRKLQHGFQFLGEHVEMQATLLGAEVENKRLSATVANLSGALEKAQRPFETDFLAAQNQGPPAVREFAELRVPVGLSPNPGNIVVGREGYLFLLEGSNGAFSQYSLDPARADELAGAWVGLINDRARTVEAAGKAFLQLIVPEKLSVIPERFPIAVSTPTPLLARIETLLADSAAAPNYCSALTALLQGDPSTNVRKVDSHFTPIGTYRLLAAVLSGLGLEMPWTVEFDSPITATGDFAPHMLGLPIYDGYLGANPAVAEGWPAGTLVEQNAAATGRPVGGQQHWHNEQAPFQQSVMVFGNSFFANVSSGQPYLSWWMVRLFRDYHFYWTADFDPEEVARRDPDIVITQTIERFLPTLPAR